MEEKLKTGTTTVGIVTKEGVVMATEKRATMDNFIAHKVTQKLYEIDKYIGMTTAGLVGDLQVLVRYLRAEVELYKLKNKKPITVQGAATLLANILNQSKFYPYYVSLIVGGYDSKGYHVFGLDAAGGSIEDKYISAGSGSLFVYGVLEDSYHDDLTIDEAINIVIRGVSAAMKRDSASGDGIDVATITEKEGFVKLDDDEIKKRMKKLKLIQ
ncbi:MAG: archaeal proteasome endopeptidase complex subunit beta [Thermoplasmata archaeon]